MPRTRRTKIDIHPNPAAFEFTSLLEMNWMIKTLCIAAQNNNAAAVSQIIQSLNELLPKFLHALPKLITELSTNPVFVDMLRSEKSFVAFIAETSNLEIKKLLNQLKTPSRLSFFQGDKASAASEPILVDKKKALSV